MPQPSSRDTTGGNPFLLRETCRHLEPSEPRWTFSAPGSYATSIALRLDSLEPTPRAALRLAAVMGEEVDIAELCHAVSRFTGDEVSRESLLEILGTAKSLGLLDATHAEPTSVRFPHALARQAVIETLSDVDVVHAHAAIALTLEAEHPAAVRRTVRLAGHFAEAAVLGYEREATRHLTEAGDQARGSSAHPEAADYYERAAALALDPLVRDGLTLQAARSALLGWQLDRARELDERAAASSDPELCLPRRHRTRGRRVARRSECETIPAPPHRGARLVPRCSRRPPRPCHGLPGPAARLDRRPTDRDAPRRGRGGAGPRAR